MELIYIFTLTGAFAMGAALSARQVSHDVLTHNQKALNTSDEDEMAKVPGIYLAAGNIAVIALIASIVYGGQNFSWWIPVSSLVVSFPAIYYIFLRRILNPKRGSLVYTLLALIGLVPIVQGWMA
jgi:fatty acid desaturase